MQAKEPGRKRVKSVKCLIGARNGDRHLTYPNVCVRTIVEYANTF